MNIVTATAAAGAMALAGFAAAEDIDTRRMKVVVTLTEMFGERCVDVDIVEAESAKPVASSGEIEIPNVSAWAKGLGDLEAYMPYLEDMKKYYNLDVVVESPFGGFPPAVEVLYDFDLPKCRDLEREHFTNRLAAVYRRLGELLDEFRPRKVEG